MVTNFTPQKVLHLKDELKKKNPKLFGSYMLTPKLDGWYVYMEYNPLYGWGNPKSSRSRVIPALTHLKVEADLILPKPQNYSILIGEAIIPDTPFHITNGLLNRSIGDCQALDVEFHAHDLLVAGIKDDVALNRYNLLKEFIPENSKFFKRIELLLVSDYKEKLWYNTFENLVENGEEGLIAKRSDSFYSQGKRNSDILKLKLENTFDCLAVRLEESIGEKGQDALTLISKRANGTEVRTVISKHKDKELFRKDTSSIIGKIVEIKCMEELEDGQLRQPVFKTIREDKHITDIN
jgi:ATP-dependent DNA ligase